MPTFVFRHRFFVAMVVSAATTMGGIHSASAQTFTATRLDGNAATSEFDPIINVSTFESVNGTGFENASIVIEDNIDGPSVIRIPSWIPVSERVHEDAIYYTYFAHHGGDNIRLAWSESITGPWNLFNAQGSTAPERAWGVDGNNTGTLTPGSGVLDLDLNTSFDELTALENGLVGVNRHVASPDVLVDNENQRIVMYFHGPRKGDPNNQKTFVATSKYGLNFNPSTGLGPENRGFQGEVGQGMREVVPGESYFRIFEVGGETFAYSNNAELWKAPVTNDAGEINTLSNADSEGGWWNPSDGFVVTQSWWTQISDANNPIEQYYLSIGEGNNDPRHFAIYTRTHLDPSDTNVYAFYSSKFDSPERIFLTVIDTADGSTNPADWSAVGQETVLEPELVWEGGNLPLTPEFGVPSQGSRAIGVRQLRDPYIFEDDKGTASTADDELFLLYTGAGEEAIGVASLTFNAESVLGDFDGDGDVDVSDIDFYVGNLGADAVGALAQLDLDSDGTVTIDDLNTHITTLVETANGVKGALIGDLNLDGQVNVLGDAFTLVGNLNSTGAISYGLGNVNADLTVNVLGDAFALIGNLGQNNDPTVP